MFAAKHFETAHVIAMFVCEQHTVELFESDSAKLEPSQDLARAQSPID